jgi:hypothetical protein
VHPVIARTFGGLSSQYYFRNFVFGLIYPALFWFALSRSHQPKPVFAMIITIVVVAVNTLLYPYSRFVYESIVNFILGRNVFFVNAIMMLIVKWMTMTVCWGFAIFVAPVGLAYLYFAHGRSSAAA